MPKLRNLRVVNAQFNNAKGIYQDFCMPFHGYNATYELVNGGGKSVLLMLLLQCILPNTALDPKRPFKDMFSGGDENRTTHVLAEWELDEGISEDKYLLTGFCAKKRSNTDDEIRSSDVQYFNYIHLYTRENDLDINNIPLCWWDGDDFVVQDYTKTRSMLQENVLHNHILIVDKKRDYQEILKKYYLLQSEWDLIRNINRRENHLKDHFADYKKSRALVEELLVGIIEECIRDRQRLKLGGDEDITSKMSLAEALYQSQDDLKRLQQELDLLRDYERLLSEVENLNTANDRLMRSYQAYEDARYLAASQYRGYDAAIHQKDNEMQEIQERITRAKTLHKTLQTGIQKIQLIKYNVDVNHSLKEKETTEREKNSFEETLRELENSKNYAISVNKYFRIKTLETAIHENEEILRNIQQEHYELFTRINPLGKTLYSILTHEIQTAQQYVEAGRSEYKELQVNIRSFNENRGKIQAQLESQNDQTASLQEQSSQLQEREQELARKNSSLPHITSGLFLKDQIDATIRHITELNHEHDSTIVRIETLKESLSANHSTVATLTEKINHKKETIERLNQEKSSFLREKTKAIAIVRAYGNESTQLCFSSLKIKISEITAALQEHNSALSKLRYELETVEKYGFSLTEEFVSALRALPEYYPSVMSGAEYLKNLPEERRIETLGYAPWLPKTILVLGKHFNEIVRNPSSLPAEVQDSQVIITSLDSLREERVLTLGDIFIPHRSVDHSIDVLSKDRTIERLRKQIVNKETSIAELKESQIAFEDDFTKIRKFIERYKEEDESEIEAEILEHTRQKDEYEENLKIVEQQITKVNISLNEDKIKVTHYLEQLELFNSKYRLLEELVSIEEQKEKLRITIQRGELQINNLQSSLQQLHHNLQKVEFEAQQKSELIRQFEHHIIELNRELKEYQPYAENDAEILLSSDLQQIRSEFSAVKQVIDQKSGDVGEREARIREDRDRITEYKVDIRRLGINLEEIEAEKPNQRYSDSHLEHIQSRICDVEGQLTILRDKLLEADEKYKSLNFNFKKMIEAYNSSVTEPYTPLPELFETSDLDAKLYSKIQERHALEEDIEIFEQSFQQKEHERQTLTANHAEYRIIAGIHGFEAIAAPLAEELRDWKSLRDELERRLKDVGKSVDRFETARVHFDHNVAEIPIATVFKDTIKQKLRVAKSINETHLNKKHLEDYSSTIRSKLEFTKSQIEPLKEVEKRVVDQALGMAMVYRDYLKKFPEISKINIDGHLKDMIRINFDQCIYSEERAKFEMGKYIQDLNREIENGKIGIKELEAYLRPNQLVNRVMDMQMIRVKIRKIDRGSHDFQNWEAIKASDGQENTMYIIFIVVLMSFIRDIVVGRHDKNTSKMLIIDNPFGSTGAYYLWEPIWSILERNNVQLICTGHKIGAKIREFFPFNHILTEETSESGQIRIGIKIEASGPARQIIEDSQRGTLNHWIQSN